MEKYLYKCSNCDLTYSSSDIENQLIYLCKKCGKSAKNTPLKGVLEIVYNYEELKKEINKNDFLKLPPGDLSEYLQLWPLATQGNILQSQFDKLKLSPQLFDLEYDDIGFRIFDDTRNPTLSYKDRASVLVALKALELGIEEISAASTGNAGSSLAGICARLGIKSHIFVPKNIPESKRIQIQSFGANIYVVDGDYDVAFDLCLEISDKKKWFNRNTAFNPLTIEGKKSAIFDMFIMLSGKLPEYIFVPVGDGVIISGIYKGLKELLKLGWIEKYPKLVAVQAEGSNALGRYIINNQFKFIPAKTVADSISAGAPRNLYMAADAVRQTNGDVIAVTDNEILNAQELLSKNYGILSEPAAATSFAGFKKKKLKNSILMITGNGLKDVSSLQLWNNLPEINSSKLWKNELIK